MEYWLGIATSIIAAAVVGIVLFFYKGARRKFQLRKTANSRRRDLTEELRRGGYPALKQLRLRGADLRVLAESFSLQLNDERLDGTSILQWIAKRKTKRFLIRADGGSGKTTFGMLLAASWPRFCPQLPSLYIPPSDLGSNSIATTVAEWLRLVAGRPALLIFDALNEVPGEPAEVARRIDSWLEDAEDASEVKVLFMFRPRSAKYADTIGKHLRISDQPLPQILLTFNMAESKQCSFYRCLFVESRRTPREISEILEETLTAFPSLNLTREVVVAILTDREDRIRNPGNSAPFLRSPWAALFRRATMRSGSIVTDDVKAISFRAMRLIGSGEYTSWYVPSDAEERAALRRVLESEQNLTLRIESREGSDETGQQDSFRFPNETHLSVLAALHVAQTIQNCRAKDAISSLKDLHGTMAFDDCAKFLVPALRALTSPEDTPKVSGVLIQFLEALIHTDLGNPPYSFCARVLCDSLDSELLPDFERQRIDDSLFKRLFFAIDEDRLRTCEASIRAEAHFEGPNPVLDQLFEVFRVYGNRAVHPCLDVLLSKNDPTFRSQGAYMVLYWLETRLPSQTKRFTDSRAGLDENVYNIVKRISELRNETNLHVCFHAAEVLEQIRAASASNLLRITGFEALFKDACGALSEVDSASLNFQNVPEVLRKQYRYSRQLISAWSQHLSNLDSRSTAYSWTIDVNPTSLSISTDETAFLVAYQSDPNPDRKQDLESLLELQEASLGILRRLYCSSGTLRDAQRIADALKSPAWVVRWWAFYNMFQVIHYMAREAKPLAAKDVQSFAEELFVPGEPMGLKSRQCRLVNQLLDTLEGAARYREALSKSILGKALERFPPDGDVDGTSFQQSYESTVGRTVFDAYLREYLNQVERIIDRVR